MNDQGSTHEAERLKHSKATVTMPQTTLIEQVRQAQPEESYSLTRATGPLETYLKVLHDLGLYSNLIVSATYNKPLTQEVLAKAVTTLVQEHPALSVVTEKLPSTEKEGNFRSWEGQLKTFNLGDCITWRDYDLSGDSHRKLLEEYHKHWFDTHDKTKPLWKLVVINCTTVLFVYHHLVCDGRGGVDFQRNLLTALNNSMRQTSKDKPEMKISVPETPLLPEGVGIFRGQEYTFSMLPNLMVFLYILLLRLVLRQKDWVFNDAVIPKVRLELDKLPSKEERCVTNVQSLRISSSHLSSTLKACKKHDVSFTSLLATLIQITLAKDIYPTAKFCTSSTQVDLRRYLISPPDDSMRNLVASFYYPTWLGSYRKAGSPSSTSTLSPYAMNPELVWALASRWKNELQASLTTKSPGKTPMAIQGLLSMVNMGSDEEEFTARLFQSVSIMTKQAFSISNLGAFVPQDQNTPSGNSSDISYHVEDMQFSASAQRPSVGFMMFFRMLSVKGGTCTINVNYENGVLPNEKVKLILEGVEGRLLALLDEGKKVV